MRKEYRISVGKREKKLRCRWSSIVARRIILKKVKKCVWMCMCVLAWACMKTSELSQECMSVNERLSTAHI